MSFGTTSTLHIHDDGWGLRLDACDGDVAVTLTAHAGAFTGSAKHTIILPVALARRLAVEMLEACGKAPLVDYTGAVPGVGPEIVVGGDCLCDNTPEDEDGTPAYARKGFHPLCPFHGDAHAGDGHHAVTRDGMQDDGTDWGAPLPYEGQGLEE